MKPDISKLKGRIKQLETVLEELLEQCDNPETGGRYIGEAIAEARAALNKPKKKSKRTVIGKLDTPKNIARRIRKVLDEEMAQHKAFCFNSDTLLYSNPIQREIDIKKSKGK